MASETVWRPSFPDFCRLLNKEGVAYLVLGGQASILFGVPRFTNDVDILVRKDSENASNLIRALSKIGFGIAKELRERDVLAKPVFSFMDQIKVDVFTDVPGVGGYEDAVRSVALHQYQGVRIPTLSLKQLIARKEAIHRWQDQADVEALREIEKRTGV